MSNLRSALKIFKKRKKIVEARNVDTLAPATDGELPPQQSFPSNSSQELGSSAQRVTQTRYFKLPRKRRARATEERYGLFIFGDKQSTRSYDIDIVAVHGLGGNWKRTWTDEESGSLWLRDFLPSQLPDARIMSYGYNSGTAFSKAVTDIDDEAAILLDRIDGIRQLQDEKTRSLIFVAHSLGGIVVKKALILAQERPKVYGKLLESVKGIVFFGVPHRGSEVAYWGSFVANVMAISQLGFRTNTKFVDALRRNSKLFSDISQQFAELGSRLDIRSFYETEKLYGQLIVTKDSACLGLPNEMAVGIAGANHRTMCRFKDINSQKYFQVWMAIKSLVESATTNLYDLCVPLSDSEKECLQCLCTSDYEFHRKRAPARTPRTCEWILQNEKYQLWLRDQTSNIFWIRAEAGYGKSVLASFLVDNLNDHVKPAKQESVVCSFFFKEDDEKQRTAPSALCAVLHQLFTKNLHLIKHAMTEYDHKGLKFTQELHSLWGIFLDAVTDPGCGDVVLVLDGLDECEESSRVPFIDLLVKLGIGSGKSKAGNAHVKVIITSRPLGSVESRLRSFPQIALNSYTINSDVRLLIMAELQKLELRKNISDDVGKKLTKYLTNISNPNFLFVSLAFSMLRETESEAEFKKEIKSLRGELDAVYGRILEQRPKIGVVEIILHIILSAPRPLTLAEMDAALGACPDVESTERLNPNINSFSATSISKLCGPFVTIIDEKICLVHHSAKEFIFKALNDPDNRKPNKSRRDSSPGSKKHGGASGGNNTGSGSWRGPPPSAPSHGVLAERSIWYLSHLDFRSDEPITKYESGLHFSVNDEEPMEDYYEKPEFFNYAARNWPAHFRKAKVQKDSPLLAAAMKICSTQSEGFMEWFGEYWTSAIGHSRIPRNFNNLLVVAFLGYDLAVRLLLENGADIAASDEYGWTALHWAAKRGHEAAVKFLIDRGADVAVRDGYGWPALHRAAEGGHSGVVRAIMKSGADLEAKDELGWTALHVAAMNGHEEVGKLLISEGANLEVVDELGWTALHWAAWMGYQGTAQLLLGVGADVRAKDMLGRTALHLAAERGNKAIVQLLAKDDIDGQDGDERTPLHYAAQSGDEKMARLLLDMGADSSKTTKEQWTVMHTAALYGNMTIVRLLLDRGAELTVDSLHEAAQRGHLSIVRMLVEEMPTTAARILLQAAESGHGEVLCLLLKQDPSLLTATDEHGRTALHFAAMKGNITVLQLLIKEGADLTQQDALGWGPLHHASEAGHEKVITLLAERGSSVLEKDVYGRTALHIAAANGHIEVVQLLLRMGINIGVRDERGRTACDIARENRCHSITILLEDKIRGPNTPSRLPPTSSRLPPLTEKKAEKKAEKRVAMLA